MKKKIPTFKSDKAAERFVETADLSEYDLSGFTRVHFEFEKKTTQLNMRMPKPLLDAVKKRAKARGIPYTRFVREAVERALSQPEGPTATPRRARPA
jgi:predicted DNA binding CopG/RHH family protein